MSDLKRLMDEYKARINDPNYVAPKELRNGLIHSSPILAPVQKPVTNLIPNSVTKSAPTQHDIAPQKESERMFVKDETPATKSYLDEIAKALGVMIDEKGMPTLDDNQEAEMNDAIDTMLDDGELTKRQEMWNDLMTDWRDEDGKSN